LRGFREREREAAYYSSGVAEDEDAMAASGMTALDCFFGLGNWGAGTFLVGDNRPRESSVLCSVWGCCCCCEVLTARGVPKLGMLPRLRRVIAKEITSDEDER
jgi:hypothetical protein